MDSESSEVLLCGLQTQARVCDIRSAFNEFGTIKHIFIIFQNDVICGFVRFGEIENAKKSVQHWNKTKLYFDEHLVEVKLASDLNHLIDPKLLPSKSDDKSRTDAKDEKSVTGVRSENYRIESRSDKDRTDSRKSRDRKDSRKRSRSPHEASRHRGSENHSRPSRHQLMSLNFKFTPTRHGSKSTSDHSKSSRDTSRTTPRARHGSRKNDQVAIKREENNISPNYIKKDIISTVNDYGKYHTITSYNVLTENKSVGNVEQGKFEPRIRNQDDHCKKEQPLRARSKENLRLEAGFNPKFGAGNLHSTVMRSPSPKNKIERFNKANANESWSDESELGASPKVALNVPHEDSFKEIKGNLVIMNQ